MVLNMTNKAADISTASPPAMTHKPIRRMCVIYRRSGKIRGKKLLACDEQTARKVFFSNRTGYGGCGIEILRVEEYSRTQHERLCCDS